jgi:hypothetical protein
MTGRTILRSFTTLALLIAAAAPLGSHAVEVKPVIKGGVDLGGETIATATFSNGSTESIKANEGAYFGGGASILLDSKDIEIEATLSIKYTSINASNGDITWTRFPLEVLAFYRMPKFRLGGGLTYHLSPKLKASGAAGNFNVKVDDAAGAVLQADYFLTRKFTLGGRYTILEYKANGIPAKSNGVGITIGFIF